MDIVMATDNNYAEVMMASINSICKNNKDADMLFFHIIDDGILDDSRETINRVIQRYQNSMIEYIRFDKYSQIISELVKDTNPPLPLITFARLFISEMVDCDRILYIDCDTICNGSLKDLWNIDLKGNIIAAIQDLVNDDVKRKIGLQQADRYINAGILLIDVKAWKDRDCTQQAINFIRQNNGKVMHNDQGVINALFIKDIMIISPKYNLETPALMISYNKLLKYFGMSNYYSKKEICAAIDSPVIIHFVRFTTSRPWETGCHHPLKNLFIENYVECTGEKPVLKEFRLSRGQRVLYWILNNLPYICYEKFIHILKLREKMLKNRGSIK